MVVHGRGSKRIKRVDFGINGVVGKEKKRDLNAGIVLFE